MNPRLSEIFLAMDETIGRVEQELELTREQLEKKSAAHERALQQYWSQGKRLGLLESQAEEYDELMAENRRLKEAHKELRNRLQRLLESTKLLGEALRQ